MVFSTKFHSFELRILMSYKRGKHVKAHFGGVSNQVWNVNCNDDCNDE